MNEMKYRYRKYLNEYIQYRTQMRPHVQEEGVTVFGAILLPDQLAQNTITTLPQFDPTNVPTTFPANEPGYGGWFSPGLCSQSSIRVTLERREMQKPEGRQEWKW